MFTAHQRLRDRLELRKIALIAILAAGAFGLQLAFLAGMVASPLGGAIADLDRIPQVQGAPTRALAEVDVASKRPDVVAQARAVPTAAAVDSRHRAIPPECVVARSHAE